MSAEDGNLVDEFEESFQVILAAIKRHNVQLSWLGACGVHFLLSTNEITHRIAVSTEQACVHALTKQEASTGIDKDEISTEVDRTTSKFIDLARQMESFFIQKRFLLSVLKPELMLKEENSDLRYEICRKDELIKKHYERIEHWKNMLTDQQQQHAQHMPQPQPGMPPMSHSGMPSDMRGMPMGMPPKSHNGPAGAIPMANMTPAMQVSNQSRHSPTNNRRITVPSAPTGAAAGTAHAAAAHDASSANAANASKCDRTRPSRSPSGSRLSLPSLFTFISFC